MHTEAFAGIRTLQIPAPGYCEPHLHRIINKFRFKSKEEMQHMFEDIRRGNRDYFGSFHLDQGCTTLAASEF